MEMRGLIIFMPRRRRPTLPSTLTRILFMKIKVLNRGFTLIEIAIAVSIMLFLVGGGIASYLTFNDRQLLLNEAKELQTFIRSAQTKARVGDRPEGCLKLERYKVTMAAGSSQIEVSAVCDNNGTTEEFIRQTAELDNSITAAGVVDIEFNVLHGGALADTTVTLNSSGESTYVFEVTKGGELTGGELIDPNHPAASPSTATGASGSPTTSPSSSASASPSSSPTQNTTGVVTLQNATGTTSSSCSQRCVDQGYTTCVSIGTDTAGTNTKYYSAYGFGSFMTCYQTYGTCNTVLSSRNKTCEGHEADWTNCKCQTTSQ